jgi:hypothetical protein
MRIKKPLFSTLLFFAILITGILVLFFLTQHVLNSSDTVETQFEPDPLLQIENVG